MPLESNIGVSARRRSRRHCLCQDMLKALGLQVQVTGTQILTRNRCDSFFYWTCLCLWARWYIRYCKLKMVYDHYSKLWQTLDLLQCLHTFVIFMLSLTLSKRLLKTGLVKINGSGRISEVGEDTKYITGSQFAFSSSLVLSSVA